MEFGKLLSVFDACKKFTWNDRHEIGTEKERSVFPERTLGDLHFTNCLKIPNGK